MQTHADSFIPFLPLNALIDFLIAVMATSDRNNFDGGKVSFGPWSQGVSLLFVGTHGGTVPWNRECVAEHLRPGGPGIKVFEASHSMSSVYRTEAASKGHKAFQRSTTSAEMHMLNHMNRWGDSLHSNHKYKDNKGFPGFGNFLELSQAVKPEIIIPLVLLGHLHGYWTTHLSLMDTPVILFPMRTNFNTNLSCT